MNKFFPSPEKISQEIIATAIALIVVAWVVSQSPTLKRLVKSYETD